MFFEKGLNFFTQALDFFRFFQHSISSNQPCFFMQFTEKP